MMTKPGCKILIHGSLAPGGVQTHLVSLCPRLVESGAEVTVAAVAVEWPQAEIARLKERGVRFVTTPWDFGSSWGKVHACSVWPFRLRRDFDLLYCHGHGRLHSHMRRYLRPGGLSLYHEIVEAPRPGSLMAHEAGKFDLQIVDSPIIETEMKDVVPGKPLRVIQMLSAAKPVGPPPPRAAVGDSQLRVGYLGRLVPHKQPDWLVLEWRRLTQSGPLAGARLDVFGADSREQPMLDRLRTWTRDQGLDDRIVLHGEYRHEDLPQILAGLDMVVLPTLYDAIPISLVEAMQYGVPIVAMAAGGIGELAEENPDVEITPRANRVAFELGMQRLAQRLREGRIDAVRLHHWAERRYGWETLSTLWTQALVRTRECFGLDETNRAFECDELTAATS